MVTLRSVRAVIICFLLGDVSVGLIRFLFFGISYIVRLRFCFNKRYPPSWMDHRTSFDLSVAVCN